MAKKMVLKVDVVGDACKAKALNAVAKLRGVKSMAMDGEKLTVIGDVDVVRVAKALRKANFTPVVLSVGPEKEEKKPEQPKKPAEETKKPPEKPHCCAGCSYCRPPHPVAPWPGKVVYCEEPQAGCVIL
ncbi:hypothetical protein QOZ80_3BG0278380 [Eleusine coracana subsp. coracana]|nr:hypothetical protein QOZ80_3BG0278380 [Eleusine coracana subsp. coracana]